jgi:hypothetical protein
MNRFISALIGVFIAAMLFAVPASAAIGDNAPPIPSTYNASHPRLPVPDAAYLSALASNSTALAAYNSSADAWDSTNPSTSWYLRRLLIAYMANKTANPTRAATYLTKIKQLANLGGTWGHLLYSVNDGVGNGTYTVTSASANFLTGCGGASCNGTVLSIAGRPYNVIGVPSANSLTLSQNNPAPTGSGLPLRLVSNMSDGSVNIAVIYDWLYNDLDDATRTEFANELDSLCTQWEENYIGLNASPYNDVFYIRLGTFGIMGALAIYPDHPNGQKHMKFMTDVWFNVLMPVWKQVLGPEGGGWHENWTDYVQAASGNGLDTFLVPSLLCWQSATGDPVFTRESWLKNFAYFTMYMTRPDYVMESIGDSSRAYMVGESPALNSLNGLAEIYNDPVIRGWARLVNMDEPSAALDGFEPSSWPFYKPDNKSNAAVDRSSLPKVRNFTGWGMLAARTGWGEDDTSMTMKYGDNFWSHEHFDSGSFTIFSRGLLALDSGSYRAGSNSKHENQYGKQTIAHNTLTITDPADYYPGTTFATYDEQGNYVELAPPNDGGQRRAGTLYNQRFPQFVSPNNIGDWMKQWDYYHMGKLVGYAATAGYTYAAVDMTNAYNNKYSASTPNASNRTYRVQKAVRHLVFVPRGTSAYVIVYDQVNSTNASFVKKWLLHSVDQPTVNGNHYEIVRNETVTSLPYVGAWPDPFQNILKHTVGTWPNLQYKYDAKLYGWAVQPSAVNINVVGGPGKEFWVEDPLNPGTGTNWNQCMVGQCDANTEGLGGVDNFINPDPNTAPHEPGSWRLEIKPAAASTQDYFLNVMLATTTGDSNVPANVTAPSGLDANTVGATWTEGGKTYTVTFPKSGVGGHITVAGVVDEDLLAHAQQLPDSMAVVSGSSQAGAAGAQLAAPLVVVVKDAAGNAVPNAAVHFGITGGSARVSADTVFTDGSGQASTALILSTVASGTVTAMADVNGVQPVQFTATVSSGGSTAPVLSSLTCTPTTLASGATSTCTATLSQAATSTTAVMLSSSSASLTVPAGVSVGTGATSGTFTATAGTVASGQTAIITGTYNGTQSATLTLSAPAGAAVPVSLNSVSCVPSSLSSGASATCTVSLSQAATSATAVTLSSSSASLTVPASVSVASGSATAAFTATAGSFQSTQSATVTASYSGTSRTASVALTAASTGGGSIPNGTWIMTKTHGIPMQIVGFEKIVYAPSPIKKILMRGNYHDLGTEPNQALNAYDFETNSWSVLDVGESFHSENMPEGGHSVGGIAYSPNNNSLMYYCCASGSNQAENPYRFWWYDVLGQVGRSKESWPKPGMVQYESSAFDALNNSFVLQGGGSFIGTWTYNPSTNVFTQQSANGTTPNASVYQPAMAYDTTDHKVYLFGGAMGSGFSNDLYAYDTAANMWTKLAPSGTAPAPRWRSGLAYDSANNVFLMYGGEDDSTVYNDTWVFNPSANTWTQLTSAGAPTIDTVGPFENLAYDSDHNVFVLVLRGGGGFADGGGYTSSAQTWLFRYQGSGQNVGTAQATVQTTAGSINQNTDGWAKEPSLAASGSNLYTAWVETGKPFDTTNSSWFHVYAKQRSGSTGWSALGGTYSSLDSEWSSYSESHSPAMGVVAGTPWISWYKWNNSGQMWALWAKSWNGSSWQGGLVGTVGSDPIRAYQSRSQIVDVGGVPHIAFLEVDKSFYPQKVFVYVKYWNGTQWALKGSGPLNINTSSLTIAGSVSMATDGTNPYVAWSEYTTDGMIKTSTPSKVYVAKWNGSQWAAVGSSLNVSSTSWAEDASIAYLGQPYVAWTERTTAGNNQIFVKTFDGSNWVPAGAGVLTKDTNTGWAFRPSLAADTANNALYVAWIEQQNMGQRAQTFVSRYSGGGWSALGSSLNADPNLGSAQRVSLAVVGGQPVAAWGETNPGSMRQIFVKQWDGSQWNLLSGNGSTTTPPPTISKSCDVNGDGTVNVQDVQAAINQTLGMTTCGTADLLQTGSCNVVDVQRVVNAANGGACVVGH